MASSHQPASETTFLTLDANRINLINDSRTAKRNYKEYNRGLVFSSTPLQNDRVFRVQIDKKIEGWSGSLEIGVITCEPSVVELTGAASTIINGSWVLANDLISRNGAPRIHISDKNLNDLAEGETCGVMRTSNGDLILEVNGECIGIIAQHLPPRIYAVVDLCGQCIQVTLQPLELQLECQQHNCDKNTRSCPVLTPNVPYFSNLQLCPDLNVCVSLPLLKSNGQGAIPKEKFSKNSLKLRFHQHCGNLVKLNSERKSAERRDPLDEFNNGVVMTHRALHDDELFEIRIDHLVNKWSGSLEVGVTTHNPLLIEFPTTMTNMHSGTIMMSGCGILINGKGTRREYGQFNLDKLREGDRVGMMRKSNGNLHYFINGLDQGVAASKIPQHVWGVIDLYGMTIKVTIIDPEERKSQNTLPPRKSSQSNFVNHGDSSKRNNPAESSGSSDRLLFHPNCGAHAVVSNGGATAHRPRATDDFNNGVVLTNRPLRPDEVFEVRLDKIVKKWAGSIEIGVTTHTPNELDFPITMTNMRSGTWMMTGNGVMHNGTTVQDRYGSSLDRIIVGDRVGVVRQSCGTLRFYINGIDQGPATTRVPENVYGVIDLYGQAAQASIVQFPNSPESLPSSISNTTLHGGDLCFNRVHGRNVRVQGVGLVATRIASMINFEDALIFSSRPLRECEMFQIRISEILELWDSCIAFGVTAACPSEITLPSTFKGITQDTYILHGRTLIHNGCYMSDKYPLNLLNISVNSRIGVMRHADRSVHFYLDGMDQGKAWDVYNMNIYAVIDLSGQCSEICMAPPKSRGFSGNSDNSLNMATTGLQCSHVTKHIFSEYCGSNIQINNDYTIARVVSLTTMSNLVFSASLLHPDGLFEIEVVSSNHSFRGSMRIGVTDVNILNAYVNSKLPSSMIDLPPGTMYLEGNQQLTVGSSQVNAIYPSLCWLKTKDKIGLRRIGYSNCIALQLNTEEIGVVFRNVPDKVFVVFELCGPQTAIRAVSTEIFPCTEGDMEASDDGNSLHLIGCTSPVHSDRLNESEKIESPDQVAVIPNINNNDPKKSSDPLLSPHKKTLSFFHINHGGNIVIEKQGLGVRRLTGYNRAIVIASKPILRGQSFKFQVTKTNPTWNSSIMIGASKSALELRLPISAIDLKQGCWIVSSDHLYLDGNVMWSEYGKLLESLYVSSIITLEFTENRELYIIVNDLNLGCFTRLTQKVNKLYPIIDIYGQCEQVSILNEDEALDVKSDLLETGDISDVQKVSTNMICSQPDGVLEHNGNNASSYYKTIRLCEKAYLEYYEKETSSLDRPNCSSGYLIQPSVSNINFPPKDKNAKYQLSKSLSENESINLAIQNITMSDSANATNEIRNREIKRRTTIVNCFQPNNPPLYDQTCSIWSFTPYDDQFKRDFTLHRSTTLQNIPYFINTLRQTRSLENLSTLVPCSLHHLLESVNICPTWHMSKFNDSLVKYWELWELWKQCKRDVLNLSIDLPNEILPTETENIPIENNSRQVAIKNTYLKDSYRLIFNKCRSVLAKSVKDIFERSQNENEVPSTSEEISSTVICKSECVLSVLTLSIDLLKGNGLAKTSSLIDDYEYYIRVLFRERIGYLPGDDFVYYIRELFREEPDKFNCPELNKLIKMKESLDLPEFLFSSDTPQCFCVNCCQPEMITDIPNGWVRFFLNKPGRIPAEAKRRLSYWLMRISDAQKLFQVGPEPGLLEGEIFIIPCEKLPSPELIDNAHMRCFDGKHQIGEMKAALQVLIWHNSLKETMPPEEYCQTFNIRPAHYYLESIGYCQVTALLLCLSV